MSDWQAFHIFTGLVGPFMVLLHSSWKFQGLAGAVMLMTVVIVVSGFIGRYIYTEVPRSVDGVEVQEAELEQGLADMDVEVKRMESVRDAGEVKEQEIRKRVEELTKEREKLRRQVSLLARTRRRLAIWHTVHIPLGMDGLSNVVNATYRILIVLNSYHVKHVMGKKICKPLRRIFRHSDLIAWHSMLDWNHMENLSTMMTLASKLQENMQKRFAQIAISTQYLKELLLSVLPAIPKKTSIMGFMGSIVQHVIMPEVGCPLHLSRIEPISFDWRSCGSGMYVLPLKL